jgi:hypothetical protein
MATKATAELVSAAKLSAAVDKAVKIAAERHGVAVSATNVILNWELIGRILRDANIANKFAVDVAATVSESIGTKVQPATVQVGRQIWCGFFERARIPISRNLL